MEKRGLEIIWLKYCVKDFKNLEEKEFIRMNNKLKEVLSNLIQNTYPIDQYGLMERKLQLL